MDFGIFLARFLPAGGISGNGRPLLRSARLILALGFTLGPCAGIAFAVPISNPVATFAGLDKITARVTTFDVYIGETVQFGALQITPRVCYTRPADETQRTSVFAEIDQVSLKGAVKRVFTGWMFAESPALNAVDNAIYDVWLTGCKQKSDVPPPSTRTPAKGDGSGT